MRLIWICLIDGVIIKSGAVQPGDTMPLLTERLMKSYPHTGPDSLKVIGEDGRVFDSELPFPTPTSSDSQTTDDVFAAVGVVDNFVGVKIHRDKTPDEILEAELSSFTGKITDNMDFGIFDFSGEQLVTIEEMLAMVSPDQAPEPIRVQDSDTRQHRRRARRAPGSQRRGRHRFHKDSRTPPPSPDSSEGTADRSSPTDSESSEPHDSSGPAGSSFPETTSQGSTEPPTDHRSD